MKKPDMPIVPWNPVTAVSLVALLYVGAQAIGGLLVSLIPQLLGWNLNRTQDWLTKTVAGQFSYVMVVEALTVAGLLAFLRYYKTNVQIIGLKRPKLRDAGVAALAYPVYFILFAIVAVAASQLIPGLNVNQEQQIGFESVQGAGALILTFISLVVLPPLVEELLVRGFLFGSLRKYVPFGGAALITSLLFAAAHLPEGGAAGPLYIAAIDTFLLSMVLCWLREKTGSLWAGIGLHAIKNGVAFVSLFILASR